MNTANEVTSKPVLPYRMRNFHSIETNEKYRRADPVSTGTEDMNSTCAAAAADGTYGAIRPSLVKNVVLGVLAKVEEFVRAGKTVVFGDYFRCKGCFSGGMDPVTGRPTKDTVYRVRMTPLKKMIIPVSEFELECVESEIPLPSIISITSTGLKATKDALVRGKDGCIAGRNLYFDAAQGDTLTVSYVEDGETQTVSITPTDLDSVCFRFKWPAALAEVPDGTELKFRLSTRCGIAGGAFALADRTAVLVAG